MFFIFLLTQRHLHPADVENRPNGLTINIFIVNVPIGRTASVMIVRPKSEGNGCTYDLAERYRLMQSICRTRELLCLWGCIFNIFFKIKTHYGFVVFGYLIKNSFPQSFKLLPEGGI